MSTFVAIDFETADHRRDSACEVGLVVCRDGRIVHERSFVIRPPRPQFSFTGIHGLRWADVRDAPTFGALWPTLRPWIDDADFLAAHNAPFDRSVLLACCARYGIQPPAAPFTCTVRLARAQWSIYPTRLPDVCRALGIDLQQHHAAAADAAACARIVLAAEADGWQHPRAAAPTPAPAAAAVAAVANRADADGWRRRRPGRPAPPPAPGRADPRALAYRAADAPLADAPSPGRPPAPAAGAGTGGPAGIVQAVWRRLRRIAARLGGA